MRRTPEKIFWVVTFPVMLVLALMAVWTFIKTRNVSSRHACMYNLYAIAAGKEAAALSERWDTGTDCDIPTNKTLINQYIKLGVCPDGGVYSYNLIGQTPTCSKFRMNDPSTYSHHLQEKGNFYCGYRASLPPHYNRRLLSTNQNDLLRVLGDFDQVIRCTTNDAGAYVERGFIEEKLGRKNEAVADFRKAQALGLCPAGKQEVQKRLQELQAF